VNEDGILPAFDFIELGQPGVAQFNQEGEVDNEDPHDPLPGNNDMLQEQIPDLNLEVFDGIQTL
jgi:hypothetical protein